MRESRASFKQIYQFAVRSFIWRDEVVVLYRSALDSENNIVTAESLVGKEKHCRYTCLSCEREMVARVNGSIKRPHFAHKAVGECNGETYLHKLAKKVFVKTFRNCQESGKPFTIRFDAPRVCNRFKLLTCKTCNVGRDSHEYDLTQYYSDLRVEKRDGRFVPDVSLLSEQRPDDIIYIEIKVNHFLSEEKAFSGKRIIEIPVKSEDDIERIKSGIIDSKHASFMGFFPEIHVVPDDECSCKDENFFAFYVLSSGRACLTHGCLSYLENKINKMDSNLIWFELLEKGQSELGFWDARKSIFESGLYKAYLHKVPFKNCILCKHRGQEWQKVDEHFVFCKLHKKAGSSNYANRCSNYEVAKNRFNPYTMGY